MGAWGVSAQLCPAQHPVLTMILTCKGPFGILGLAKSISHLQLPCIAERGGLHAIGSQRSSENSANRFQQIEHRAFVHLDGCSRVRPVKSKKTSAKVLGLIRHRRAHIHRLGRGAHRGGRLLNRFGKTRHRTLYRLA
jgi:hypothetical protein